MVKNLVVLTGAGISAESGIKTFRDMNGWWNTYNIEEVASPKAWNNNPELVCQFYNERREQLLNCTYNNAHKVLVDLENKFNVEIITQNVDDLHERAGSKNITHLHGEILKARCTKTNKVYDWTKAQLNVGDLSPDGFQLRPHIVWFGESVLEIDKAIEKTKEADIFLIIGTSLKVFPAASLGKYLKPNVPIYLIDQEKPDNLDSIVKNKVHFIQEKASIGIEKFSEMV